MQLLLIPLLVLVMVLLWALLLPVALIQRYRYGKSRRRAVGGDNGRKGLGSVG